MLSASMDVGSGPTAACVIILHRLDALIRPHAASGKIHFTVRDSGPFLGIDLKVLVWRRRPPGLGQRDRRGHGHDLAVLSSLPKAPPPPGTVPVSRLTRGLAAQARDR